MAKFNPENIDDYLGRTFVTKNGSHYHISNLGTFIGKKRIDNEPVLMIVGVKNDPMLVGDIKSSLPYDPSFSDNRKELSKLVFKHGQEINKESLDKELRLVVMLTEEGAIRTGSNGIITSKIEDII